MSEGGALSEEAAVSPHRRIAEVEMRSTAAADALTEMIRTQADTVEVERRFKEEMDALLTLRQQLWELRSLAGK